MLRADKLTSKQYWALANEQIAVIDWVYASGMPTPLDGSPEKERQIWLQIKEKKNWEKFSEHERAEIEVVLRLGQYDGFLRKVEDEDHG